MSPAVTQCGTAIGGHPHLRALLEKATRMSTRTAVTAMMDEACHPDAHSCDAFAAARTLCDVPALILAMAHPSTCTCPSTSPLWDPLICFRLGDFTH